MIGCLDYLPRLSMPDKDGGVWPILLSSSPATNQLRDEKAAAEKQNGDVQEDLKTLLVAEMEPRHRNIPSECEHGTR